jgi:protein tyrosine phosphatase
VEKFRIQIRRGRESKSYTPEFAKAYAVALQNTINEQLLHSAKLVADFWYTSWVDAGKPDLSAITANWTKADKKKFRKEQKIVKANKLLENNLLLSKKTETKEGE